MATTTGQKVRVKVLKLESGGHKLRRPPGPDGRPVANFYVGEVVELPSGEAESLVSIGLVEFVDRVKMRALVDEAHIGNRCCNAGEVVEVPTHRAGRYMDQGIAERVG